MKQPIKYLYRKPNITTLSAVIMKKRKNEKNLDGSGLETYFKLNFLEKLGVEYVQQFHAEQIGRFYDFYLPKQNIIIECDGSFFHCDPRNYTKPKYATQIKNKRVDEIKNNWATMNGFVLLRFWEYDIYNNPKLIINELKNHMKIQNKKIKLLEDKKNGVFFIKKK